MLISENDNNNNIKLKKKNSFCNNFTPVYSSGLLSLSEGKNIHVLHDDRCNIK